MAGGLQQRFAVSRRGEGDGGQGNGGGADGLQLGEQFPRLRGGAGHDDAAAAQRLSGKCGIEFAHGASGAGRGGPNNSAAP